MRILWLCNIVLPELSSTFGFKEQNEGGWLTGAWNELKRENGVELAICVPIRNSSRSKDGIGNGFKYYSFITISNESDTTVDDQIARFREILQEFRPDVIHIWGTEFEHSYSMAKASCEVGVLDNVVVNIQGLISECAKVFTTGIDKEKLNIYGINTQLDSYIKRAKYEDLIIALVKNVIGRTEWDKDCLLKKNPNINYFYCGEILRDAFYKAPKWDIEKCEKHTVFVSQAGYPIKGFHMILDELKALCEKYSDFKIKIAGPNLEVFDEGYPKFIVDRINELNLMDNIEFLGELTTNQMIANYQEANAFLSPSLIENSSNSICEAMIIGTPIISSCVGGIPSIVTHGVDGYLYPLSDAKMMSKYFSIIFENGVMAETVSMNSIKKAEDFNSREKAIDNLKRIYSQVAKKCI